jgi:hypothetical protein
LENIEILHLYSVTQSVDQIYNKKSPIHLTGDLIPKEKFQAIFQKCAIERLLTLGTHLDSMGMARVLGLT